MTKIMVRDNPARAIGMVPGNPDLNWAECYPVVRLGIVVGVINAINGDRTGAAPKQIVFSEQEQCYHLYTREEQETACKKWDNA